MKFAEQRFNHLRTKFPPSVLSEEGFDLLNKLLTYDPSKRISAQDALNHPWFDEYPPPKDKVKHVPPLMRTDGIRMCACADASPLAFSPSPHMAHRS